MPEEKKIGFVGFGAMASRMAARLHAAGYTILVWDRSPEAARAQGAERLDARLFETPRQLAEAAPVVLLSLPDDDALDDVLYGESGLIEGLSAGSLVLDTSTVSPAASVQAADAARLKGAHMLDAAVSGSTPEAEAGELVALVGGDADAFARARPVLDVIASKALHLGAPGSGSTAKLVVNGIMGLGLVALAEGLRYGEAAGLDPARLHEVLEAVAVVSPHHKKKLAKIAANDYAPQFPARLMSKDFGLLLASAHGLGLALPAMGVAAQLFATTAAGNGDEDYSAEIRTFAAFTAREGA